MFNLSNSVPERKKFWNKVCQRLEIHCKQSSSKPLPHIKELDTVRQFHEGRLDWKNFIPNEWIEIYGALFDESRKLKIDVKEKTKIEKDVKRTFGLFLNTSSSSSTSESISLQLLSSIVKQQSFFSASSVFYQDSNSALSIKLEMYCQSLQNVLLILSHQRDYSQGINFLAGYLILSKVSERDCFIYLSFLLRQRCLEILFDSKYPCLLEYMMLFQKKLRSQNKPVYSHLKSIGFDTVCYGIEWFTTCFLVTAPGCLSYSIIDLLFCSQVSNIMLRVGLAIMDLLSDQILLLDCEEVQLSFRKLIRSLDPVEIVVKALLIQPFRSSQGKAVNDDFDYLQLMSQHVDQLNELPDQSLLKHKRNHVTVLRNMAASTTASNESVGCVQESEDNVVSVVASSDYDADIDNTCLNNCGCGSKHMLINVIGQQDTLCRHQSQRPLYSRAVIRQRHSSTHELHIRLARKLTQLNDKLRQRCAATMQQLGSRNVINQNNLTTGFTSKHAANGNIFQTIIKKKNDDRETGQTHRRVFVQLNNSNTSDSINNNSNYSSNNGDIAVHVSHSSSFSLIHPIASTLTALLMFQPASNSESDTTRNTTNAKKPTDSCIVEAVLVAKGLYLPRHIFLPFALRTQSSNTMLLISPHPHSHPPSSAVSGKISSSSSSKATNGLYYVRGNCSCKASNNSGDPPT